MRRRDVINEHDLAVYLLGDFETCIEHKFPVLRRGIQVPIVVMGGPSTETLKKIIDPPVDGYVGNVGRFMHRTKESEELEMLDEVVAEITRVLDKKREEIAKDPPSVSPARLMDVIKSQVEEIHEVLSPTPITVQMTGLRVKLPYDTFAPVLKDIVIEEGGNHRGGCRDPAITDAGLYPRPYPAVLRDEYHGLKKSAGFFSLGKNPGKFKILVLVCLDRFSGKSPGLSRTDILHAGMGIPYDVAI